MSKKTEPRKKFQVRPQQQPESDPPPFNALVQKLTHHQTTTFLILTFLTSLLLLGPYLNDHGFIAPGDHRRDFYTLEQTMHGKVPYQDYWWVYGPLMPYYYAGFLKVFGVSIVSILAGKVFLRILTGLLLYLGLCTIIHPAFA